MGRYLGHTLVIAKDDKELEQIFDEDFLSNEEYFRPDTLALGYRNEAQRIIQENRLKNDGIVVEDLIHRAFQDSYYLEYEYEIDTIGEQTVISIAYLYQ